jgi:cation diffusion facilitator CzcD-associated flavoprotein CzcO
VYKTWTWTTNYPDWHELQAYFDHVDKVCELSKDCAFGSVVTSSEFDTEAGKWTVQTADGRTAKCRFLIIAAGFAAKRYIPDYPSMDKFKGVMHHSSFWPTEGVDARGQKVAVIGTGASGVQIIQEWGPQVEHLTVFQRTPNLALPMGKRDLTKKEQEDLYPVYDELLRMREKNFAGFTYDFAERNTFEDSPEEREALYESLWKKAGFGLWLGSHKDYLFDMKANRCVYDFWRKKQMTRIRDPAKREVLCPEEPPHAFGVKRPCLEQYYYEVLDRDNVTIVDISEKSGNNIAEFTETGIRTTDGKEYELDIIALATGFDIVSRQFSDHV